LEHLFICKVDFISLKYDLIVKVHKTKYMKCSRRQEQLTAVNIENKAVNISQTETENFSTGLY